MTDIIFELNEYNKSDFVMIEQTYKTSCGEIHYWVNKNADQDAPQLVFLPGLTADHRLFKKQIEYFEGKYPVFVWDAPGHAASWPFTFEFDLIRRDGWIRFLFMRAFTGPLSSVNPWAVMWDRHIPNDSRRNYADLFRLILLHCRGNM